MSRKHIAPKATAWAYGLTEPAVSEVEGALTTMQQMWDYCDDIKRNRRTFGGSSKVMLEWSKALAVFEKLAEKYLSKPYDGRSPLTKQRIAYFQEDWSANLIPDIETLVREVEYAHGITADSSPPVQPTGAES